MAKKLKEPGDPEHAELLHELDEHFISDESKEPKKEEKGEPKEAEEEEIEGKKDNPREEKLENFSGHGLTHSRHIVHSRTKF